MIPKDPSPIFSITSKLNQFQINLFIAMESLQQQQFIGFFIPVLWKIIKKNFIYSIFYSGFRQSQTKLMSEQINSLLIFNLFMKMIRKASMVDVPPERLFIGIAGGSAAGKTSLCENINRQMAFDQNFKVEIISLDSFYKSYYGKYLDLDKNEIDVSEYNFDNPQALDFDLAFEVLTKLKNSHDPVAIPKYSFIEYERLPQSEYINPGNVIFFQGLLAFHDERIRNMMTYKIFINCDDDIRLCRRLKRDTTERGRTVVSVLKQYNKFVKDAYRDFVYPTIKYADLVIPGFRNNRISVDFIVQHIKNLAKKINLFEKAYKTKLFILGENQYYDKNVKKNYQTSTSIAEESFLVFPTSEEHRRQLNFYLNILISESFSQDYFQEVFVYQFMKVCRSLLKQLIELKSINKQKMELIPFNDLESRSMNDSKNVKVIFIPSIFSDNENVLEDLKEYIDPSHTIIILNIFCSMKFPNKVYQAQINGLIFINLYLIPSQNKLMEMLNNHNANLKEIDDFSWFLTDNDLNDKSLKFVANQLQIKYDR